MIPDRIGAATVHRGSFADAQKIAAAQVKFTCAVLTCADHVNCSSPSLLRALGGDDPELADLMARRCVLWTADVDTAEGECLADTCEPVTFPFVVVSFKNRVHMELQGSFTAAALKAELKQCMADADGVVAREVGFAADRDAREAERNAMEAQLAAVAEEDRRRAEAKAQAERARREADEADAARLRRLLREADERAAAEAQARLDAEHRKALAMSNVPDVPPPGAAPAEVATIRLTTLSGATEQRVFFRSTALAGVYCWAAALPGVDGEFELVAGFPPRRVDCCKVTTIGETPVLLPRCAVTMKRPSSST